MVSHVPNRTRKLRIRARKMVKGKRRTNRGSKDENAVVNSRDGPTAPKDCRLDAKGANGAPAQRKAGVGSSRRENKISNYFSPARSPPVADDAEAVDGGSIIKAEGNTCRMEEPEDAPTHAQLSRTPPPPHMNGHVPTTPTKTPARASRTPAASPSSVAGSPSKGILSTPPKRTVCTRSQALKELQLQSPPRNHSPPATNTPSSNNGIAAASSANSSPAAEFSGNDSIPNTPTSSASASASPSAATSTGDDSTSPHTGPPTPHKIQALNEERLRLDSPLSPATALSKLKLSLIPKKLTFNGKTTKARRKLPTATVNRAAPQARAEKGGKQGTSSAMPNGDARPPHGNKQMTEFFPIRRSERKPKTTLLQERQKEIEERITNGREEGLTVKHFGAKGRGVVTTRKFVKGEFVVEYIGDLIDVKEAKEREKRYALDSTKGCYNYYFTHQNQQYCIDATEESGYLGRLVNHSRSGNLVTKAVEVAGRPHLILLAKRDLDAGTEILYDYGDRSKEALQHHPWLAS